MTTMDWPVAAKGTVGGMGPTPPLLDKDEKDKRPPGLIRKEFDRLPSPEEPNEKVLGFLSMPEQSKIG